MANLPASYKTGSASVRGTTSHTVTITIASPAVLSWASHGLLAGDSLVLSTTGALPTGLVAGTTYYVLAAGLTTGAFELSATPGGAAINTSGSQSGTHTAAATGSPTVVGSGTAWSSWLQAGDTFEGSDGKQAEILSVTDDTHLVLDHSWPGTTQAAAYYRAIFAPDVTRLLTKTRSVLDALAAFSAVGTALSTAATDVAAHDIVTSHGTTIPSAGTLNLDTATGDLVDVSGTTTTTAITLADGSERTVRATGAWPITVSSNLVLNNNGNNYTCAAGDVIVFRGYGGGIVRGRIQPIDGVGPAAGTAAFKNTGTSGANVPLLNGANTYSGLSSVTAAWNFGTGGPPSDFWSASILPIFFGNLGYIGSNGANSITVTSNHYRAVGGGTNLGAGGSTGLSGFTLMPTGLINISQDTTDPLSNAGTTRWQFTTAFAFIPGTTASYDIGGTSNRVNNIYLSNNPNVSSDERMKVIRGGLTPAEVAAGLAIGAEIVVYQDKARLVAEGADVARLRIGVSAQRVQAIMTEHSLDAARYSFWCADAATRTEAYQEPWTHASVRMVEGADGVLTPTPTQITEMVDRERQVPVLDEAGLPVVMLSVRYEQLAMFVAVAQSAKQAALEDRIAKLESA